MEAPQQYINLSLLQPAAKSAATTDKAGVPLVENSRRSFDINEIQVVPPDFAIEQEDVLPNGGYGWVCVACVFSINASTWGVNSAYGVFLAHYLSTSTFPSATPLQYAFIGGLSISQALIVSPISTAITRIYGIRVSLIAGIALQTVALVGASFATQIWQLFLSQGVCFGWGIGFLFVGCAGIIPQWFSSRRSLATGITTAGVGFGGLAYNLAAGAMIERIGLPWAYRVISATSCVTNVICMLLLRDRNKAVKPNQLAFDYRFLRRFEFLLVLGWGFLSELGYVVLLFSLPNYALSVGLTAKQGYVVGALLSLGLGVGRPIVGYFSDAMGRLNMSTLMTGLCGVLCFVIWIFAKSFAILCLFAILSGMVCGTFWSTIGPVSAEVVGLKDLPSSLSITFMVMVIPTTFAEPIALKLRREAGNIYLDAQIFTGFMFIGAALCSWLVRSWMIIELERKAAEKRQKKNAGRRPLHDNAKSKLGHVLLVLRQLFAWKRV